VEDAYRESHASPRLNRFLTLFRDQRGRTKEKKRARENEGESEKKSGWPFRHTSTIPKQPIMYNERKNERNRFDRRELRRFLSTRVYHPRSCWSRTLERPRDPFSSAQDDGTCLTCTRTRTDYRYGP